jgi:hypothetical protein
MCSDSISQLSLSKNLQESGIEEEFEGLMTGFKGRDDDKFDDEGVMRVKIQFIFSQI